MWLVDRNSKQSDGNSMLVEMVWDAYRIKGGQFWRLVTRGHDRYMKGSYHLSDIPILPGASRNRIIQNSRVNNKKKKKKKKKKEKTPHDREYK